MAAAKIRVGLIGASILPEKSWGTRAHIPALRHLPEFELAALCTSRPETAEAAARHFGVSLQFSDPRRLAEHPGIDLVAVSVRTPLHREMVAAAVSAGKHVYCEWPLGVTTDEARDTLEATRRAGVVNMIGLQGRANEALRYTRDLIAEGFVGRMESVTLKVTQANFGPVETADNAYTADIRNGADILRIATAQALEAVLHAVGDIAAFSAVVARRHDTAHIPATGQTIAKTAPDQVLLNGVLASGAVLSVHVRGGSSETTSAARLEINGDGGDLLLTSPGAANIHRAPLSIHGARRGDPHLSPMAIPERYALQPKGLSDGPARYLAHNYVAFAAALRGEKPVVVDLAYALRWQRFMDAIQRASDTGERQIFPPAEVAE